MSKTLIIYYSMQGHTKKVAEIISQNIDSDLVQLIPEKDYNLASSGTLGLFHIKAKKCPKLRNLNIDLNSYENIYIGTPVWWYTFVPHVRTFLKENNLSGKSIKLFSTNAGNNGTTFKDMKYEINSANIIGEKAFYTPRNTDWSIIEKEVENWLK